MTWDIRQGDSLNALRAMPDQSVQCCVTSPPYFGLRDYRTAKWEGGDAGCDHLPKLRPRAERERRGLTGGTATIDESIGNGGRHREFCGKCGARRVDSQIGLEATPDEYVASLVQVFREVRRVLRNDGTLWLNIGDSYNNADKWGGGGPNTGKHTRAPDGSIESWNAVRRRWSGMDGCKPKDLIGIPWMVAFALRADGWYLRSAIIWSKPNPMPESITDRPTSAYEHVFLLTKSARYFYDAQAIAEPSINAGAEVALGTRSLSKRHADGIGVPRTGNALVGTVTVTPTRNKRNVWDVATQPYAEAHFATFPTTLIEPCILAGSSPRACGECGAPWERDIELVGGQTTGRTAAQAAAAAAKGIQHARFPVNGSVGQFKATSVTRGRAPTCSHNDDSTRSLVLDPFTGSGTVGVVCEWHARDFVGIELNSEYAEMARKRIAVDGRLGRAAYRPERPPPEQEALFGVEPTESRGSDR